MPATTSRLALPYPIATDPADVPADMLALANKLDPATSVFGQGLASARPAAAVAGRFYYATDTGALTWDTGTAWKLVGGASGATPPLVSSLPASPTDGQEVYFLADATRGIVWHLRYRSASASAYKWECVGGPPLQATSSTTETTTSTAYVDVSSGPTVTPPLAGEYDVQLNMAFRHSLNGGLANYTVRFNNTDQGAVAIVGQPVLANNTSTPTGLPSVLACPAAPMTSRMCTGNTGGTATFSLRRITADPIRVG